MGLITYDLTMRLCEKSGVVSIQGPASLASASHAFLIDAKYEIMDGEPVLQAGYSEVSVAFDANAAGSITLQRTGSFRGVRMKTPGAICDQRLVFLY